MHIEVLNSQGRFVGSEIKDANIMEMLEFLSKLPTLSYLRLATDGGFTFFQKELLKESVVTLKE